MATVSVRAYLSPSLVLLAMDWPEGEGRTDFLGFAIRRTPGFTDHASGKTAESDWLPNRLSFDGPPAPGKPDFPSNLAPIQKFLWWDARLEGFDAGDTLRYEVFAVCGTPKNAELVEDSAGKVEARLPGHEELGIGTWFNRAVMGSQAFSRKLKAMGLKPGEKPEGARDLELRSWLANGMEKPVPEFIRQAPESLVGAIYHLTDTLWIEPALEAAMAKKKIQLVYEGKPEKGKGGKEFRPNQEAIDSLGSRIRFLPRTRTAIMHNKFLVSGKGLPAKTGATADRVICGSANYTTEGLTSQANLVHSFDSPDLASLYLARFRTIQSDPSLKETQKACRGWSRTVSVGDAGVRVFFSPEEGSPGDDSESIETIVQAIHGARSSVIFCLFCPTDEPLRDACFAAGDAGKMMFGLVNHIVAQEPTPKPTPTGKIPADQLAALELYHRSRTSRDVIGAEHFDARKPPPGFEPELNTYPGEAPPPYPPVLIHHKFIVVDAETNSPVIYSGSANMSGNSVFRNDENLLEIKGSPRLAQIYLAEFLRLYEHYRARAHFIAWKKAQGAPLDFSLRPDRSWADRHFQKGTPEYKARVHMLGET